MRKAIETSAALGEEAGLSAWRQSAYNVRCLKKDYRRAQQLKRSTAKDPEKRAARQAEIRAAHEDYLRLAEQFIARAHRIQLEHAGQVPAAMLTARDDDLAHAARQIDPVRRRVLHGETIPHHEKVFSIFEPHTDSRCAAEEGQMRPERA